MQQQPLPLPLPEPPAEVVDAVLEELRQARRELADADRLRHLLRLDPGATPAEERRLAVETAVAGFRHGLWRLRVETAEARARSLGLDVTSTL